jgi:creatinine amidohydrolase/Fe(II)-dependent formamide hydrolase-like protein
MRVPESRMIGHLVSTEVAKAVRASSVICLPMGSIEQHGPHLPLNTDCVIAEALTRRIVARWGGEHDLWQLPVVPVGLSREHAWAPGTLSLTVSGMTAYLRDLARELARALPARNLLIVNGHGGNRGILEALTREVGGDFGLNIATLHLGAMMSPGTAADVPEIHAGKDETSVMLALAPELVRREAMATLKPPPRGKAAGALVLDPAASYPWSSDDPRLSESGIMGDARGASAAHGEMIVARVVEAAGAVIRQLTSNAATNKAARSAKRKT